MNVDDWLHTRTYPKDAFDVPALCARKRADGARVSVVLPARRVATTIAPICTTIRERWMAADTPLVDELVVIDAASEDGTADRARAAGATVVQEQDVRPDIAGHGKGAAMWRSLAATTGDIVVWIDADIVDFDPGFVPQLVGPLITEPQVAYVKGFFERPLADTSIGGGRVSEICARPLINRFRPQLAGFVQPLSGEAAGRRTLLERMPFPCGYAVEIGLLWDIEALVGIGSMAQVDLGTRRHHHQPTVDLGRMAAAIMDAVLRREGIGAAAGMLDYRSPLVTGDEVRMRGSTIATTELPPLASTPGVAP